ncbi:MAG: phage terminase large subunit [Tidjanibacter sp.]|nr:phage terminase large subunit [Tidjanibacter sp.]
MSNISFSEFIESVSSADLTPFHTNYYRLLERFARGDIRKLIVTMPPQHGKSFGASEMLPAYMLGLDPELHIAIASYSASLAQRFNKRIQRLIDSDRYKALFPDTTIKSNGSKNTTHARTAEHTEIIDHSGEITAVGREGPLTGNRVDIFIIDDLYKDAMEANSPVTRENCWEWYTSVVRTRMHNDSRELIVFTRWHHEDLIGRLLDCEPHTELTRWEQLDNIAPNEWIVYNLQAIKESPATETDPRQAGEPLWPERQSKELLEQKRLLDPLRFECMYQGQPNNEEGVLYGDRFATYQKMPDDIRRRTNYTDTADTGDDYLCSICYCVDTEDNIYIEDVVYSRERMEVTEQLTAEMMRHSSATEMRVESNNGGRGFARTMQRMLPDVDVGWFYQSANKEARILSNASTVLRHIHMPRDWKQRWPDMAAHLISYNRRFRSNRWHDAPDVLTGIVERELAHDRRKRIRALKFN